MSCSLQFEGNALGLIIYKPYLLDWAIEMGATADTFAHPETSEIFAEILKIRDSGHEADAVTLIERLPRHEAMIVEMSKAYGELHFRSYIETLKRQERLRAFRQGVAELQGKAVSDEANLDDLLSGLTALETKFALETAQGQELTVSELVRQWRDERKDGALPAPIRLFAPGTKAARCITLRHGEILTIGAQTGYGKTALACGMVVEALRGGLTCAYLCAESSSQEILTRIVSAACGVKHYAPDAPGCRDDVREKFAKAMDELDANYGRFLHIRGSDIRGGVTPAKVDALIRRAKQLAGRCDLVVIDFLQIMQPTPGRDFRHPLERINGILDDLHYIVSQQKVGCIILSQCNRSGLTSGTLPELDWLKDTTKLAELSHCVAFLVCEESNEMPKNPEKNKYWLLSRKTRGMPRFTIELNWNGTTYESKPEFPLP